MISQFPLPKMLFLGKNIPASATPRPRCASKTKTIIKKLLAFIPDFYYY